MADYTPILDTQTDPDAPLTSDLAKAWAENPVAIAEGADGAPKIMGAALGDVYRGVLTIPGSASPVTILGLDRVSVLTLDGITTTASPAGVLRVYYSTDGGSTWTGGANMGGTPNTANIAFGLSLDIRTGVYSGFSPGTTSNLFSGTVVPPAGVNAVRFSNASAGVWGYAHVKAVKGVTP